MEEVVVLHQTGEVVEVEVVVLRRAEEVVEGEGVVLHRVEVEGEGEGVVLHQVEEEVAVEVVELPQEQSRKHLKLVQEIDYLLEYKEGEVEAGVAGVERLEGGLVDYYVQAVEARAGWRGLEPGHIPPL